MRSYASIYVFCAVLVFAFSGAPLVADGAADGAAEYRAPVSGVKLGPVKPAQPAQPVAPGQPAVENPAAPQQPDQWSGQRPIQKPDALSGRQAGQGASPQAAGTSAPSPSAAGQPTPWPTAGGMAPYSSFGSLPGPADVPGPAPAPPAAAVPNPAAIPGTAAVPPPAPLPAPTPEYAPGYAPYAAPAPAPGWQGRDIVSGTGQLEGNNYDDRGVATQYRDPQTGDIITSVVPPLPPEQQNYGTIFVAPQIYPDGSPWGPNPYGPMPRPGGPSWPGQQNMPPVIWQPAPQPDHNRYRHDDRRHDDRRYDDRTHDGRHDGPRRDQYDSRDGGYGGPDRNRGNARDYRGNDRYNPRSGSQDDAPYDQRGAGSGRDGRERR